MRLKNEGVKYIIPIFFGFFGCAILGFWFAVFAFMFGYIELLGLAGPMVIFGGMGTVTVMFLCELFKINITK